jgi:hypothetical protein
MGASVLESRLDHTASEQGLIVSFQQIGRVLVDGNATSRSQCLFGKAAAENTYGPQAGLAGSLRVIGGITHNDSLIWRKRGELRQGSLEDVRKRLRPPGIIR